MGGVPITLLFADGVSRRIEAQLGESVVSAAENAGLTLLTDCSNGQCGTCAASLVAGSLELGNYDKAVLPDSDRLNGAVLTCISRVTGPCAVEFPYDSSEALTEESRPLDGCIATLEQVAAETMLLEIDVSDPVDFEPGQYVRLQPPGTEEWRSYSMASCSNARRLAFYVRLVDGGRFSTWLKESAQVGDGLEITEPHGSFFLRREPRPRLFIAGGTGLAPFLSMLESIAGDPELGQIPTTLLVGVRTGRHLFALQQLESLRQRIPSLTVQYAAEQDPVDNCHSGYATELITSMEVPGDTRVYLCGPPAMVEAGRTAAEAAGLPRRDMLCERFN